MLSVEFLLNRLWLLEKVFSPQMEKFHLTYICIFKYWLICIVGILGGQLIVWFLMTFQMPLLSFYHPLSCTSVSYTSLIKVFQFSPFAPSDHWYLTIPLYTSSTFTLTMVSLYFIFAVIPTLYSHRKIWSYGPLLREKNMWHLSFFVWATSLHLF